MSKVSVDIRTSRPLYTVSDCFVHDIPRFIMQIHMIKEGNIPGAEDFNRT